MTEGNKIGSADLRKRADEMLLKQRGGPDRISSDIVHELEVHQIELEMQNDELHRTQQELEASREKYFELYDLAPVGYVTLNEKGLILETNLTAAALLGKERSDLVKQPFTRFIFREDQDTFYRHRKLLFETLRHREFEVRMLKGDGTQFWARVEAVVVRGNKDKSTSRMTISDITHSKMTAELHREQLRNLCIKQQHLREEERANIAREIHDELGQIMAAVKMNVAWIQRKDSDRKGISDKSSEILKLIDGTIKSIRRICTELRPDLLDHLGLGAAIQWQAEEFRKRSGIPCEVTVEEGIPLDSDRRIAMFRIFQEALTNVVRHADATKVEAILRREGGKVILKISDNGKGITEEDISKPGSFGLLGMRERVYPWNGIVAIKGNPDGGTTIEVILPDE